MTLEIMASDSVVRIENLRRPLEFASGAREYLPIIAGPCVVENWQILAEVADELLRLESIFPVRFVFKSSFRKANRTNAQSFIGIGDAEGLDLLAAIRSKYELPVLTDIHGPGDAAIASASVDILQIPAFLARQTELLQAAARTGRIINIKKGQFMAPQDMEYAAGKVAAEGNENILLCERGTFFGYGDLVVDMRSISIMASFGRPVVFDATHSVQRPSQSGRSSGDREYIPTLAKAALAAGAHALFLETHPDPEKAMSDRDSQLPLAQFESFLSSVVPIWEAVQSVLHTSKQT